jgi:TatD DNase family protein
MILIDTHCHLYLPEFDADRSSMMERAQVKGVNRFYLPSIDHTVIDAMIAMEATWSGQCFPMMGLHPCSVLANYKNELVIVEEWLGKRKFAAVGEIGLDFYWDKTFKEQQYEAFKIQMEWALKYDLPVVIHSRDAMKECIDTVKPYAAKGLKGIFHCFGDSLASRRRSLTWDFI